MSASYSVIIPARYASQRLVGKPLLAINQHSLIWHVHQSAMNSQADQVIIATDDQRIYDHVEPFADVQMTKDNHQSGSDRIAEVIIARDIADDEIIVNLQGDEFAMPPELLDQVAESLAVHPTCVAATLCYPISDIADYQNPNVVKVVFDQSGRALYFSRAMIPANRHGGLPKNAYRHIGLYAYRAGYLKQLTQQPPISLEQEECLEQLRILFYANNIQVEIAKVDNGIGVDTEEDLVKARALAKSFNK